MLDVLCLTSVLHLSCSMQNSVDKSNIQEVKISSNSGLSLVAVILLACMALNAYTLLKVTTLSGQVSKLISDITPILVG